MKYKTAQNFKALWSQIPVKHQMHQPAVQPALAPVLTLAPVHSVTLNLRFVLAAIPAAARSMEDHFQDCLLEPLPMPAEHHLQSNPNAPADAALHHQ